MKREQSESFKCDPWVRSIDEDPALDKGHVAETEYGGAAVTR